MWQAIQLIVLLIAPLAVFAVLVHLLEQLVQRRLAHRLGWRSLMWTAWLGTPVHELSHALMCLVFRHRIDELALFQPDAETGRLGFVRHSYQKGNGYQEIGNVFIAVAPLLGGTLMLTVLLWLFYPQTLQAVVAQQPPGGEASWLHAATNSARATLVDLLTWEHFRTPRLWLFLYLAVCVGSHMAPSWSDYRGAAKGAFLMSILLGLITLLLAMLPRQSAPIENAILHAWAPIIAILALALALCLLAAAVVYALTAAIDLCLRRD